MSAQNNDPRAHMDFPCTDDGPQDGHGNYTDWPRFLDNRRTVFGFEDMEEEVEDEWPGNNDADFGEENY